MTPLNPRRSRARHTLAVALFAAMSVASCGGADKPGEQGENRSESRMRPPSPTPASRKPTPVRITVGDTELTGRLHDNATARDLVAQLPLSLSFHDHNNVEKATPLPRELSLDGAPAGHDPVGGETGYSAPDGHLVLYHDDAAPHWNGIDGDLAAVKRLPEGARVTIEPAG